MQSDHPHMHPTTARSVAFDAGLQAFFRRVYNTMTGGLVLTGLVAFLVSHSPAMIQTIYGNQMVSLIVALAPLGFIMFGFTPRRIAAMPSAKLNMLFYIFSAVFGLSLSYVFLAYSGASIARVFFISAGMFAATSIYGYTTKKDLTGLGGLMMMGAIGILIAMLVNLFLHSAMIQFVVSVIGVVCYTGLVAWDTQNLKEAYRSAGDAESNNKLAVMGALSLYIDFLMIFQFLLRLMGGSRN